MTNYERIINRSIYEMASELEKISNYVCGYYDSCDECPFNFLGNRGCNIIGLVDWLNSEVEE